MNTIPEEFRGVGYKVFDKYLKCRGYQYEVGKTFEHKGELSVCKSGFHLCDHLVDCFNYYQWTSENRVCVVNYDKRVTTQADGGDKKATARLFISHELTWEEVMQACNHGNWNTGHRNTGDWNTGHRNTGNSNTGNSNTGNWNTGHRNTGSSNTGNSNNGDSNTGNWNTGHRNTGDSNTGNSNTGDWNTGNSNTGDWNTGHRNTGDSNTGNSNTGNSNTGHRNTGDWNTGHRNTGHRNTGDWNTGHRNTGYLCAKTPAATVFDEPTTLSHEEIKRSEWFILLSRVSFCKEVYYSDMTEAEKEANPSAKTTGQYIKTIEPKQAWLDFWVSLTDAEIERVKKIPNFTAEKWEAITGIKI